MIEKISKEGSKKQIVGEGQIKAKEHLYELYPQLPKFANDPSEWEIIQTYDRILNRYQHIYGRQPSYFIRSPASMLLIGTDSRYVNFPALAFSSTQNIVIAIGLNGHQQVRVNHYQQALYGERKWATIFDVKYEQNDDYGNLLVVGFKAFSKDLQNMPGVDLLIYDDFHHDTYLQYREGFLLGLQSALHFAIKPTPQLKKSILFRSLQLIHSIRSDIHPRPYSLVSEPKAFILFQPNQQESSKQAIKFPSDLSLIMAHSLTPLPQHLTKGKRENLRCCELIIGIQIMKSQMGAPNSLISLYDLQKYLDASLQQLIQSMEEYIPKGPITVEKIEHITEKSLIEILKEVPYANNVIDENPVFNPHDRILFYLRQAILLHNVSSLPQLFTQSSKNTDLLQNGSQEINELIKVGEPFALGSKIIGDGWGGNVLFLCEKSKAPFLKKELISQFYQNEKNKILLSDDIEQYVHIIGCPATGLSVLDPQSEIWF